MGQTNFHIKIKQIKKIILLFGLLVSISFNGNAQWVGWTPVPESSIKFPDIEIPALPVIPNSSEPSAPAVIQTDLNTADCYDFIRQEIIKTQVRAKLYSNGDNMLLLVGKKINNEWIPVKDVYLLSIESLLSDAKSGQEKSTLLQLSENFNFIAVDENENFYGF